MAADEELVRGSGGPLAIPKSDSEVDDEAARDNEPVQEGEVHDVGGETLGRAEAATGPHAVHGDKTWAKRTLVLVAKCHRPFQVRRDGGRRP